MPNPNERKPRMHGVFSTRSLTATALAVLLIAFAGGGAVQWFYALPPKIDGAAFYNRVTAEATGDLPFDSPHNAVVHYRTLAIDVLGYTGANDWYGAQTDHPLRRRWRDLWKDRTLLNLTKGDWDDPGLTKSRELLSTLRPVIEALDTAADARAFRPRYSASGDIFNPDDSSDPIGPVEMRLTHIGLFRSLAEFNAVHIRASSHTQDWPDVVRRVRTGLRHTRHLTSEPLPWAAYWGVTMESGTLSEVCHMINEHDLPLGVCDELIAELEEAGPMGSLATTLRVQRSTFPSMVRYIMLEDTGGVGSMYFWTSLMYAPPTRFALRDGDRFFDELEAHLALPYAERSIRPIPNAGAAAYYLPAFGRVIDELDGAAARRAATLALLRLERFHALNGRWPATLGEAMTPEQALEPVTGKPFVYLVGSDGMRPEVKGDDTTPYLPSDLALARTRVITFEEEEELAGPRWPFTLLAPTEAMFVRDSEFTTRREALPARGRHNPPMW
jgi:hypothetical protein